VVTSVLVSRGGGNWLELVGGYTEWLAARAADEAAGLASGSAGGAPAAPAAPAAHAAQAGSSLAAGTAAAARAPVRTSLSYKEAREFAELPGRIENLEEEQKRSQEEMSRPDFFKRPQEDIRAHQARLAELETTLATAMARWEALMAKDAGSA
jgi:ATP-binding cassette subfamily F protein uup